MRSLKAGLIAVAVPSLFATLLVVGCSADGSSDLDPTTEQAPTDPSSDTVIAPDDDGSDDKGGKDAGSKDAGKKDASSKSDAGKDSGPPAPNEGDPCTGATKFTRACGNCGTQEAYCVADGTDGGTSGKVGKYTTCSEPADACTPGDTSQEACGNCGKVTKTCSNQCKWTSSACNGQPANSCVPGSVQWAKGSCDAGYTNATCSATCQWSAFSPTCGNPVNDIVVGVPAGLTNASPVNITFSTGKMASKLSGTCPSGTLTSGNYPYAYVEVKNSNAAAATVTVYASPTNPSANTPFVIDTMMGAYDTPAVPVEDTNRKNCKWGVNDQSYSDTALTIDEDFSILKDIVVPGNSSILVYLTTWKAYDATDPTKTTGTFVFNVKRTN